MNLNPKVTDYIQNASPTQIEILEETRGLIHNSVEGVEEAIKWGFPVFNNGKDFTYLRVAKNHITLGFYHIDKIQDPDALLEGSGNTLKHIKITNLNNDLKNQIRKWLIQITS